MIPKVCQLDMTKTVSTTRRNTCPPAVDFISLPPWRSLAWPERGPGRRGRGATRRSGEGGEHTGTHGRGSLSAGRPRGHTQCRKKTRARSCSDCTVTIHKIQISAAHGDDRYTGTHSPRRSPPPVQELALRELRLEAVDAREQRLLAPGGSRAGRAAVCVCADTGRRENEEATRRGRCEPASRPRRARRRTCPAGSRT